MGASPAGTPENGGYVVAAPCRGGDNGLAAALCDDCGPPLLYDCGVSTGLKLQQETKEKRKTNLLEN